MKPAYIKPATVISAALVSLSGFSVGHGIPQAINIASLDYGVPKNNISFGFPFYPDHKGAGLFVRSHLETNDIVIAEDMLQQKWYVTRVDYWLRDIDKSAGYLYIDAEKNIKDIYVNSLAVSSEILRDIQLNEDQRIWLITSGESYMARESNLNKAQIEWLTQIELQYSPVYNGRDKLTNVYCINCEHDFLK